MQANNEMKFWYIKGFNLLAGMSQEEMMRVASMTKMTKHARGEVIYLPGDFSDKVYFLKEGRVKLSEIAEDGREVLLDIIEPGVIFGEVAALQEEPHSESAQVLQDALLCEMERKDFENLFMMYPQMALRVYKRIGLRLKKTESRLVNLICKDVSTRVKEMLSELASAKEATGLQYPIKIKLTQQDIADLIGASRQETAKALKQLEDDSIVELKYRSIVLIEPGKLRSAIAASGH